ncbi:hypothetical protein CHQ91_24505 [Klebsiella michiganensis]|nr:hypothetical protein CHQ91_24505 [Klebsiella michiganensis]
MVSFIREGPVKTEALVYPNSPPGGAPFFACSSGDSFSWTVEGRAIHRGSKNKQNINLICSVLFRLMYRYFMLFTGLFLFIFQQIQNIIFA